MTSAEKEQLDIQYLYRTENAWQFRVGERTPDYHTKSFADAGRHSDVSLQEAREYRNNFFEKNPHLRPSRPILRRQLQKNNRTGIIGVNYAETKLPSGTIHRSWQMTCPHPTHGSKKPRTAAYSIVRHGDARALMMAVQARRDATLEFEAVAQTDEDHQDIKSLVGEYDDIIAELRESIDKGSESPLLAIIHEARLDATSKRSEISVRLGQHRFRRLVLERWRGCCAATGADLFVDASHIKPWCDSSNFDRINPDNGIALSPLYHKAFDRGFISFADDGSLLVAESFRERLLRVGMNLSVRISGLTEDHLPFLEHHRKHFFRDHRQQTITPA
jgi:hypothetical protein